MIVFVWDGFPQYAARCVGAVVRAVNESVRVVASRPNVPIRGMEALCGCPVDWLEQDAPIGIDANQVNLLFVSGWFSPRFNQFARDVRAHGGSVVVMSDNNFNLSFKEFAKAIRFRLSLRTKYDGFFVPGKSGYKLLRFYGVPARKIQTGLYTADHAIFHAGRPLPERPKTVIFVGQFVERKNVVRLCHAFEKANVSGDWTLELYGSGPLRETLDQIVTRSKNHAIRLNDFLQPEQLAMRYREARIFCLPSIEEHWGLVVHEAALSGCMLALSRSVGAATDLLSGENGIAFDPLDESSITAALAKLMAFSDEEQKRAQRVSEKLASAITVNSFVQAVAKFRKDAKRK